MNFNETPAATTLRIVMHEAMEIVGRESPADVAERVRQHVMDRWYWFEAFGVTRRADLAPIKVTLSETPAPMDDNWGTRPIRSTSVSVVGTPLESKIR